MSKKWLMRCSLTLGIVCIANQQNVHAITIHNETKYKIINVSVQLVELPSISKDAPFVVTANDELFIDSITAEMSPSPVSCPMPRNPVRITSTHSVTFKMENDKIVCKVPW